MILRAQIISGIKKDTSSKNETFYKVFFKGVLYDKEREKVFFAWPKDSYGNPIQAHQMLSEKMFKEGDTVNAEYREDNGYNNLILISRVIPDTSRYKSREDRTGDFNV
jgi:hypothetical protein